MRRLTIAVGAQALLLLGCGASQTSTAVRPARAPGLVASAAAADGPRTATDLVTTLRAIAQGTEPGRLSDHVDQEFAARLPSGDELQALFDGWPDGCVPELHEGPGYGSVAIPPPMDDDSPDEVTRIEGIIEVLRATTGVDASCAVIETYQDEADSPPTAHERTLMLFSIAARADEHGVFHALAWRDFRRDGPGNQ